MKLEDIIEETKQLMMKDGTITCYGDTIMTDCNNRVSPSAIALRELCIYGNINDAEQIQEALIRYGTHLDDHDIEIMYKVNVIDTLFDLLSFSKDDIRLFKQQTLFSTEELVNKLIDEILLHYWRKYTIPTTQYHKIGFKYNVNEDTHYISYKDVKKLILRARDSGGHLDCFGYICDNTLRNCIHDFIANQVNIQTTDYCRITTDNEQLTDQLHEICEELFDVCCIYMSDFKCDIY